MARFIIMTGHFQCTNSSDSKELEFVNKIIYLGFTIYVGLIFSEFFIFLGNYFSQLNPQIMSLNKDGYK